MLVGARHNQYVTGFDFFICGWIQHVGAAPPYCNDGDIVLVAGTSTQAYFLQRVPEHLLRRVDLGDAEIGDDWHVVHNAGIEAYVGGPAGAFHLWEDYFVRAYSFQDIAVQLVGCTGDDKWQIDAFKKGCNQDATLGIVVAQSYHRYIEVGDVQLFQYRLVGGGRPDRLGNVTQGFLNLGFIYVYRQDIVTCLVEFTSHRGAKTAQADDAYLFLHRISP